MLRSLALALGSALLAVVLACSGSASVAADAGPPTEAFRIPVSIQTSTRAVTFRAELADTPEERTRGLMFRTQMGDDEGMLFLFPTPRQNSFWMRNTLIPLDMIFIREDRTILGIVENAEPKTETSRAVPGPSQFVLEINGGLSRKLGLEAGQTVTFMAPLPSR
jgi:uncharacterized membrane protein (UPF0127 family)